MIDLYFDRLVKDTGVYYTLDTYKNEKAFIDVIVFLHHTAIVHVWDLKIGPRYFKRHRRTCSVDTLSMNDLVMNLTTDSMTDLMIDSATDSTMFDI